MKRQRQYNSRKVLVATAGLAAVSYVGTTACGQTDGGTDSPSGTGAYSSGNLMAPSGGGAATGGTGGGTGSLSGTGAYSSGNLMAPSGGGVFASGGADRGTGGLPGTGAYSSGNLMPYPSGGGSGGACDPDWGGAAGDSAEESDPCLIK